MKVFRIVSVALVAISTVAVGLMFMTPGSATPSDNARNLSPDPFTLACKFVSASEGYFVPPESLDAVKEQGWPTSPEDALARVLSARVITSQGFNSLQVGTSRVATLGDSEAGETIVTQYSVMDASDAPVAVVSIQDVGFGAYAPAGIEVCSK